MNYCNCPNCQTENCPNAVTEPASGASVQCSVWLADWAYRAARHMRNTENTSPLKWGVTAIELLAELRDYDPETYEREVKSANNRI